MARWLVPVVLAVVVVFACLAGLAFLYWVGDTTLSAGHEVTYRLGGTAETVGITYSNVQGGTEQRDAVRTNWTHAMTGVERGQFVYISAQNNGRSGSVSCQIVVDEVVFRESTSSGAYAIATCSGRVGR